MIESTIRKPLALITGATAGIGQATAIRLAGEGYRLLLAGRRAERLKLLASDLKTHYGLNAIVLRWMCVTSNS
jgi:NADP-dependent 3-hydroxy acid dehydrogenase YdfG